MRRGVKSRCCILQWAVESLRCMMQQGFKSMIVAEIFPLHDAVGSQIFLLYLEREVKSFCCIMQRGVKSCRCILQRGVKSYRCMMQQGVKSYRCIMHREVKSYCRMMQRGVESKNSGRLPRHLKRQSCKTITCTFTIQVLWESCIKALPTYNLFLTPLCMMRRGVKLHIQITPRTWSKRRKDFRVWIGDSGGHFWWEKT